MNQQSESRPERAQPSLKDRIILVLDVQSREEAMKLVRPLHPHVGMFKVGMQLFTAEGPSLVRGILDIGGKVFLDMKFHDIPNTVTHAVLEAAKLGVSMITVHAAGGRAMMETVSRDLQSELGRRRPLVVAVTVLTSLSAAGLSETGVGRAMEEQVVALARLAEECGMAGVVCSPQEVRRIRSAVSGDFKIVTPGIRMPGQSADDQQRLATPKEALDWGADYIVVGRAVTADEQPRRALDRLVQSCS
jgi:orotidine-5'-phosphate decarboxylase